MLKRRALVILLLIVVVLVPVAVYAAHRFNQYWIHRFDTVIARQAAVYRVDPDLVWSIIYEETYFSPWKTGDDEEVGLMQVTPTVGREWAAATGMREFEEQMRADPESVLRDPERNIQIGCWYLEKISKDYRDTPGAEARMAAAYNAGPSRALAWNRTEVWQQPLTTEEFVARIDIASTRAYVTNVIARYREIKERGRR
ncbi:MAG TPA: transglycosylase SLT domain-containing protein [Pyrinomonadaceae bacterium]|nr:transglycosylase SLT domain-containing protein [Pyrinomonadaceae bacterium]